MYVAGLSIGDVAGAYDLSRQAMHAILKRRGVRFRPNTRTAELNHFWRGGYARNASLVVTKAIRKGLLSVQECEVCHLPPLVVRGRQRIHAHHDDYNKLLSVRWLCKRCHHEWHKSHRAVMRNTNWTPTPHPMIASMGGSATWERDRAGSLKRLAIARSKRAQ